MTDDELRRRFSELRRSEARAAPPFSLSETRRSRARPGARLAWTAVPVAAALALVFFWSAVGPGPDAPSVPPIAGPMAVGWVTSTDVLLDTPGAELMREIPDSLTPGRPAPNPHSHLEGRPSA